MRRGLFITFEGTEGSGKSTQANLLCEWLTEKGQPCIFTREPGGTEIGETIRRILLNPIHSKLSVKAEVLLFLAARAQLTNEVILPAIQQGKIVISDRYSDSTFAYQIFGRNLPQRPIMIFNRFATAGLKPDITFWVDIPVSAGLDRARQTDIDRFEAEDISYHLRVREGYLKLAKRARGRIKIIDGKKKIEQIQNEIREKTKKLLLKKGYKI